MSNPTSSEVQTNIYNGEDTSLEGLFLELKSSLLVFTRHIHQRNLYLLVASVSLCAPLTKTQSQRGGATVALRQPYLQVIGLEIDTDGTGRGTRNFTGEEETEFAEMAAGDRFYERFSASIAPSIFGSEGTRFFSLSSGIPLRFE